jgi:hypothetical protein
MELNRELIDYILRYHRHLMTDIERQAEIHLVITLKRTLGRTDVAAQEEARKSMLDDPSGLSDDRDVLLLAKDGYEAFQTRTAKRILQEYGEQRILKGCPKCGELLRTPTARQCRFCNYDWHREE